MKFKDASPAKINRARGEAESVGISNVDDVLHEFVIEDIEPLLPNEGAGRTLSRSRALNGEEVRDHDLSQLYRIRMKRSTQSQGGELAKTAQLAKRLEEQAEVEYAEPNYRVYIMGEETISSNPAQNPSYPLQWGIKSMKIDELWTKPIVNEKRPIIAILDTGVDTTHPDLKDNITAGYDFINETSEVRDYNAHGTHVAGIAAAADNGIGIIGANPKALIMPVTVMQSDGTGDIATIIKGIDYAAQNGATVINMSLGSYSNSKALRQACERAYQKCVIVAAAGNDGSPILRDCNTIAYVGVMYPAAYSFVLGVQATDSNGTLAGFSNYDCDGPFFSVVKDIYGDEGCNYELSAPGVDVLSTVPNGGYKQFNGTSMAAPLVAGAISALQMVKQYDSQETLWGDLLHTGDFLAAYNVSSRPAELDVIGIQIDDRKELGSDDEANSQSYSDGRIDAGETISLYPVLRTVYGEAKNIKLHLEVGENEDASLITVTTNDVDFGFNLSPYGKNVSQNPIVFKTKGNIADGRHIKLKLTATCDNSDQILEHNLTVIVDNMMKIGGMISKDMTLTKNKSYLVTSNLAIPENVTLTIEPGTIVRFESQVGISSVGHLIAIGTPQDKIVFTSRDGNSFWDEIICNDILEYCIFEQAKFKGVIEENNYAHRREFRNCIFRNCYGGATYSQQGILTRTKTYRCNYYDLYDAEFYGWSYDEPIIQYANIVNSNLIYESYHERGALMNLNNIRNSNYFNCFDDQGFSIAYQSETPSTQEVLYPSYLGSSKESIVRKYCYDVDKGYKFGAIDLTNMLKEPVREAHGIVWKVVVNGYDSQDEYDELPPLGVGRHKFEVYYNRPMNKEVAPNISFGIREPYTQNPVNEDGAWNDEGTKYTAYATITKRTNSDGVNRIYVYGGEDDEFFECPNEKTRFNINVQAASSMSTGFTAVNTNGHVELSWNKSGADGIEDAMGYNICRYTETIRYEEILDEFGNKIWDDETDDWKKQEIIERDTIRINPYVIDVEVTSYVDTAVEKGKTYYYYYKLQGTNLKEYGMSNVVRLTLDTTNIIGDLNGDGKLAEADVKTLADYIMAGQYIKNADMNNDGKINATDIVLLVNNIK